MIAIERESVVEYACEKYAKQTGKQPSSVGNETGYGGHLYTRACSGVLSKKTADNAIKFVADYFEISVRDLWEEAAQLTTPARESE